MITPELVERLTAIADADDGSAGGDRERAIQDAIGALPPPPGSPDLWEPVTAVRPVGDAIERRHGVAGRSSFAAGLIATLALRRIDGLGTSGLPDSVVEFYGPTFERLADHLTGADLAGYWADDDSFLKDLRMVGGYSVPCGAFDVDLFGQVGRRSGIKAILQRRTVRSGWKVLRHGGAPWYVVHVDPRNVGDFSAEGWARGYELIADLLARDPSVKGTVFTSWFYDPVLLTISPRLAYLQVEPQTSGAYVLRNGPGAIHTERATFKSATRRELYERGEYIPTCYTLVWPRTGMTAWAANR